MTVGRLLPRHLLMLLMGLLVFAPAGAGEIATIKVADLNVRSGPGIQFDSISRLAKGMQVRVLAREKGWLKIESSGTIGYIRNLPRFAHITTLDKSAAPPENTQDGNGLKESRQDAESMEGRLQASRQELAAMDRKEQSVLQRLNALDQALNTARVQIRAARAGVSDLQAGIEEIGRQTEALQAEIQANETYASQRLVALYKLNWIGRIHLLATAESFYDFINRRSALQSILRQDERLLEKLHQAHTNLESLLEQLNLRKAEKRAMELELGKQIHALNQEQVRRTGLLATIRNEKTAALAALEELTMAARELDSTVQGLRSVTVLPPKTGTDQEKQKVFGAYKGLLSWPVKGKIVTFYGPFRDDRYNVTNFQSGINIQAERGEPIRAVSDGHAIFSSWFKGYGNMLIIDHGEHYYTVYAHLEEVFKVKGDRVENGEVIATVGDSGSLTGPGLHFEVRHHGTPMDPLQWIKKG